ncbi:MAG: dihydrolipoyl dehydrogenase [Candidatus Hydrogenedentes bacterium]|nr:dihydrolipoyl dehydrogenase [Candidatus Hydrogenedentota bacterium]
MSDFDLVVIGAGPGGYVAAIRAAQLGAKTAVIERQELGGVCLNWGCIPTKTLIHTAELYRKLQHAEELGLEIQGLNFNMKTLLARKREVIKRNKSGVDGLLKANKIEVIHGDARITAPGQILVGDRAISAKSIIIATGSAPAQIPGLETNGKTVITSTEALELESVPRRVAVIGAGPLGSEFACVWNAFGAEVTLIEMLPSILPNEDEEITKRLSAGFKQKGIDVRTGTKVASMSIKKNEVTLELDGPKAGSIVVDIVLVGIGRKFHSEVVTETPSLGVQVGKRGEILVNDRMETSVRGIFAIGDVVGRTLLAHGASSEGLVAAANAFGANEKMDYTVVPGCTFTSPEVASVGLTEKRAIERGRQVKTGRFLFKASGRAQAMGETDGMVKIVGDAATDELLGVHIMGPEAGELIASAALAMKMEATVEELAHTIHTHPTLAEAVMEAAEDYLGIGIHTPPKVKR